MKKILLILISISLIGCSDHNVEIIYPGDLKEIQVLNFEEYRSSLSVELEVIKTGEIKKGSIGGVDECVKYKEVPLHKPIKLKYKIVKDTETTFKSDNIWTDPVEKVTSTTTKERIIVRPLCFGVYVKD